LDKCELDGCILDGRQLDERLLDERLLDKRQLDERQLDGRLLDERQLDGCILDGRQLDERLLDERDQRRMNRLSGALPLPPAGRVYYVGVTTAAREGYETEQRFLAKDGSELWGRVDVTLVRDAGKRPHFVLSMVQDVTQHKLLEDQFEQHEMLKPGMAYIQQPFTAGDLKGKIRSALDESREPSRVVALVG
jgi:PAS domain-containing protein